MPMMPEEGRYQFGNPFNGKKPSRETLKVISTLSEEHHHQRPHDDNKRYQFSLNTKIENNEGWVFVRNIGPNDGNFNLKGRENQYKIEAFGVQPSVGNSDVKKWTPIAGQSLWMKEGK